MSLKELQSSIAQLPRQEQAELLRFLARELRGETGTQAPATAGVVTSVDRARWLKKLEQLRALTASRPLRPSQEILDELRADRI